MAEPSATKKLLCDIATTAFGAVGNCLHRDQHLAESVRSGAANSRQFYREECITTELVATLREKFPTNVDVRLFTASEEKRWGADW